MLTGGAAPVNPHLQSKCRMFNLESWLEQFNPTTADPDRPSPDFSQPEWARRLMYDVPRLARAAGQFPPYGWDEDCWHQELRETLIKRSQGRGKWDPARGRTTWASWATLVMQTRNINLRRSTVGEKANLVMLCTIEQVNMNTIESYDGEGITIQNGVPKWQRAAKAAQQRERRSEQQRTRRAKAAALAVV